MISWTTPSLSPVRATGVLTDSGVSGYGRGIGLVCFGMRGGREEGGGWGGRWEEEVGREGWEMGG